MAGEMIPQHAANADDASVGCGVSLGSMATWSFRTRRALRGCMRTVAVICLIALSFAPACAKPASLATAAQKPQALRVRVLRTFPHDRGAFTQGLLYHDGKLYESTGLLGRSTVRRVDLQSGTVEAQVALDAALFGEGLARVGGLLFQLTWQNGRALVFSLDSLRNEHELTYDGEGWGLCYDGKQLVMSDGSDRLALRDPRTFAKTGEIRVHQAGGQPFTRLNELECANGAIYANIWQKEHIARIDPRTGEVTALIDASGLLTPEEARGVDVMNGIAHVPGSSRFLLTGKFWPRVFEVEFVPER